jgi:hypothetical protein
MIVLVAVLIALGALVYTISIRTGDLPETAPASPAAVLEERKAAIYENLRDLQFEYRVGKLSDEDYQRAKLDLQRELAAVMAEIDAVSGGRAVPPPAAAKASPPPGTVCPSCGARFPQPLKFCGECGKPMSGGAA